MKLVVKYFVCVEQFWQINKAHAIKKHTKLTMYQIIEWNNMESENKTRYHYYHCDDNT